MSSFLKKLLFLFLKSLLPFETYRLLEKPLVYQHQLLCINQPGNLFPLQLCDQNKKNWRADKLKYIMLVMGEIKSLKMGSK